ncbi:MAG: acyl-ACP--UDP-N-acetylglucosamine O-acyltransferase [bacterium]
MPVHPTAVVEPGVELGPRCTVGPFCHLSGRVRLGRDCRLAAGVAIGAEPMDWKYSGEETAVVIGDENAFHEYATVHRATGAGAETVIGSRNRVMAYVHIAHNCRVGDGCVITNACQLGGHVELGDGANLGGMVGVHQCCRIGELAMVGAHSYVNRDIPPFMLAAGRPCRVRGLNRVGLERAGVPAPARAMLKRAWKLMYGSVLGLSTAVAAIERDLLPESVEEGGGDELRRLLEFIGTTGRGIELRAGGATEEEQCES